MSWHIASPVHTLILWPPDFSKNQTEGRKFPKLPLQGRASSPPFHSQATEHYLPHAHSHTDCTAQTYPFSTLSLRCGHSREPRENHESLASESQENEPPEEARHETRDTRHETRDHEPRATSHEPRAMSHETTRPRDHETTSPQDHVNFEKVHFRKPVKNREQCC